MKALRIIALSAMLAAVAAVWLFGRDLIVRSAFHLAADGYELERIEGSLFSALRLEGLELRFDGVEMRVRTVTVDIDWSALLGGTAGLDELSVHDGWLRVEASGGGGLPERPPYLPKAFVRRLLVEHFEVWRGETVTPIERIAAEVASSGRLIAVPHLAVRAAGISATAHGVLALEAPAVSHFEFDLTRVANGQRAAGTIGGTVLTPSGEVIFEGSVSGRLHFAGDLRDPKLDLTGALAPVPGLQVTRLALHTEMHGEQVSVAASARLVHGALPPVNLALEGVLEKLDAYNATLRAEGAGDLLSGELAGAISQQRLDANLSARTADLWAWVRRFDIGVPPVGALPLDVDIEVSARDLANPQITVRNADAHFRFHDRPGSLELSGTVMQGGVDLDARLQWAGQESLVHLEPGKISGRLALADIGLVWPGARGSVSGEFELFLADRDLPVGGRLHVDAEHPGVNGLEALAARVDLDWPVASAMRAQLELTRAQGLGTGLAPLDVVLLTEGEPNAPQWQLETRSTEFVVTAEGRAELEGLSDPARITVDTLLIDALDIDRLALEEPFVLSVDRQGHATGKACLSGSRVASVCLDSDAGGIGAQAAGVTEQLWMPVVLRLVPAWPSALGLRGAIDLDAEYAGDTINARAAVRGARLVSLDEAGEEAVASFDALDAEAHWDRAASSGRVRAHARGEGLGRFALDVTAEGGRLAGAATIELPDLSPLASLDGRLQDASGSLQGRVEIAGTLQEPHLTVSASALGNLKVAPANVELRDVRIDVSGDSAAGLEVRAQASSGDGAVRATGRIDVFAREGAFELTGRQFLLTDQPDLLMAVSPNLALAYHHETGLRLRGKLAVDRARVVFRPELATTTGLSRDVVIHDGRDDARRGAPIDADVTVDLGQSAHLTAGSLETRLTGSLRLTMSPGRPSRVIGAVAAEEGSYELYGTRLDVHSGRIDFNGPMDNPSVLVRATRRIDATQLVGVEISGLLNDLQTRVFAEPPQPEVDALAMLVTGRKLAQVSAGGGMDLNRVGNAAAALGLSATRIVSRLREGVGLDELELSDPVDRESSALMLGKRLGERLYARYSYNLFNRTGGLLLRYQVRPNLSLQSELGVSRAIDLTYHREFD